MKKKILIGLAVATVALSGFAVFGILVPAGSFKSIEPHFAGTTEVIPIEIAGPEDIEIDRKEGLVFISVDDRRNNRSVRGGILVYKIEDGIHAIKNVTPHSPSDFHPHGISLFRSNDSTLYLFAINHQISGAHRVEKFVWRNDSLVFIESFEDKNKMTSPNDLVAVGERGFYVTNDHYYTEGLSKTLEEYLQRTISFVNYFDGETFQTVANGIGYANGINQSPDGNYIFVAGCTARVLYVYEKGVNGTLTEVEKIKVGTGPDNIDFDEEGNLLVGCHPQLLKFVAHAKDAKNYSPSQVIKIKFTAPNDFTVEEIFLNDGSMYSGSSIAVMYGNSMLIGSVFEPSLLYCTLKK